MQTDCSKMMQRIHHDLPLSDLQELRMFLDFEIEQRQTKNTEKEILDR